MFSTLPLAMPLEVAGVPVARISVSADNPCHDLFVRLCDVHPDGRSENVCDRVIRLDPERISQLPAGFEVEDAGDGVRVARLELWPVAHRFKAGHRLRVTISGGAHPRYNRNPGTGEPMATAQRLVPSVVSVHHDEQHRSVITLPVLQ